MKVLICGKGGSGKSTVSALIAKSLKKSGYRVLLVDADESNFGLHRLMGIEPPVNLMENLGGKRGFKEKIKPAFPGESPQGIFPEGMDSEKIPEECISRSDGIRLLVIGKIHDFGEGCACPMGMLSKMVLSRLSVGDDEIVIIDTEAGVEHFGRRLDAECDLILGVIDPTYESFLLSARMLEMAREAGTEIFFVLNKVEESVAEAMSRNLDQERIIARIPKDDRIFMDSLEGRKLTAEIEGIEDIRRAIEAHEKG